MAVERTLTIIKPDAVGARNIGRIIDRFERAGLTVLAAKLVHLTPAQAAGFYVVHKERPFYQSLCTFMSRSRAMAARFSACASAKNVKLVPVRDLVALGVDAHEVRVAPEREHLVAHARPASTPNRTA